eukprot:2696380-Amphidinium_carterae.1
MEHTRTHTVTRLASWKTGRGQGQKGDMPPGSAFGPRTGASHDCQGACSSAALRLHAPTTS